MSGRAVTSKGEASITATSLDWLVVVLDDLSREGGGFMVRYYGLR